jgi:hypothetical protein
MKNLWVVIAVLAVFAGYHSTQAAESKDGKSYATISEGVRSVTWMDKKGVVIGKRIEQFSKEWNAWFEVEKNGSKWELTAKGKMQKVDRDEECSGSCGPDDCP